MCNEKYFLYILQSESTGRFYVGQTQNLEQRIKQHNEHSITAISLTYLSCINNIISKEAHHE
ncbi:MAG: GIY-YIG nuclease family protein [Spirochaetes bacterium]|nr:GIY-YIG nuclease family protein [Spirochaetota bacterium]